VNVIKTKFRLNSTAEVKFKSKIPSQEVTGPGIIGKKLPTIPIRQSRSPVIRNIISNYLILWWRWW
jgi:hypothetical protein